MNAVPPAAAVWTETSVDLALVHDRIAGYYTEAVGRFGSTPRGVDWSCQATQEMRFVQLLKLCDFSAPYSLNDLGCGYGALYGFATRRHPTAQIDYLGIDLSASMIRRARARHRKAHRRFLVGDRPDRVADYTVASGIMNVRLDIDQATWEAFIVNALHIMRAASRRGFAVNFMADTAAETPGLYRTSPKQWVAFYQQAFGVVPDVLQSYGMREFTLLARFDGTEPSVADVSLILANGRRPVPAPPPAYAVTPEQVAAEDASPALHDEVKTIVLPELHSDETRVHVAFSLLRQQAPLHRIVLPGIRPFRAITRYNDIVTIERKGSGFIAGPRTTLASDLVETSMRQLSGRAQLLRPLTHMDEPDHGPYRAIAQPWFQPDRLVDLEPWLADWAAACIDQVVARDGLCDFATEIAVPFTFRIIARMLGVPAVDEPHLNKLLRDLIGAEDPMRRLVELSGNSVHAALLGCRDFFDSLAADRQACPGHDLATVLAQATVHNAPLPHFERVSYYVLLAIAGYDTTAFALSGGLHALIEHPEQLARLQQQPELLESAVEEILRWTSPLRHFMRTATRAVTLQGFTIQPGESVAIFFPSANRDEAVFDDPGSFRIDRSPNPHIAFGWGPHYCLGQALARMELRTLFAALLPRLRGAALTAPPRRAHSMFLTGFTSLPVALDLA